MKIRFQGFFKGYVIALGIVLVGIVLCVILFDAVKVSGNSMLETFHSGDLVLVRSFNLNTVSRDEIVIFRNKSAQQELIKRVVAVEGDTVEIKSDGVYVNGKQLQDDCVADKGYIYEAVPEQRVKEGCVYVLGDNREVSLDSRSSSIGQVKQSCIDGVVVLSISDKLHKSTDELYTLCIRVFGVSLGLSLICGGLLTLDKFLHRKKQYRSSNDG